eukprot:390016_1
MLPSPIESVPSQTQENNVDPSTEAGEAAIMLPSPSITETAAETNVEVMEHQPHHGVEPSTEQKETIRQLQQLRGFKRSRDRAASKCLIGMNYKNRSEQDVKNLTPKKGHAKINPRTTQIRYVLDQYKQKKPILELHHAFDFTVAFWMLSIWKQRIVSFFLSRRWSRMRLCTHLLDPKRETFQGAEMRSSYKAQLFASVAKLKRKNLKVLDLQTIDLYSSQTLYSWSQFRTVLFDAGKMFFEREEAYNGLMILSALFILLFLLYSLITENIVIVWEDVILTLIIAVFILGPSMWVLSYGNGLNYQTSKQQKILSERAVDMLHFEYMAEDKKAMYWVEEIRKAREMCDAVIDVLNLHEYDVSFLGIKVDNSVFQLIVSVIGITLYLIGWLVYQNMINV